MTFFKKNTARAAVFLVMIIIASVFLGTFRSVSSLQSKVQREFSRKDTYGETVKGTANALGYHLSAFAQSYTGVNGKDDDSTELSDISNKLMALEDPALKEVDFNRIRNLVVSMKEKLELAGNYKDSVRNSFVSVDNDISILKKYSDYNKAAQKYNEALNSPVVRLFDMKPVVMFG